MEPSDACGGAAQFEIHVSEMVFAADDIGEHLVADHFLASGIEFSNESYADSGDGGFDGYASVEKSEGATANGGHGGRTVGLHNF